MPRFPPPLLNKFAVYTLKRIFETFLTSKHPKLSRGEGVIGKCHFSHPFLDLALVAQKTGYRSPPGKITIQWVTQFFPLKLIRWTVI